MSQRVKKPGRVDENQGKRRRRRPSGSDGEEDGTRSGSNSGGNSSFPSIGGMWTPRHLNDLKVSSIYNRNSAEAPAELYRKDLISAMKLADSEPLTPEEYWLITDPWKQEWEKGVQVPVNPESLPEPEVVVISPVNERSHDFRLPKKKYIRVTHDDFFNPDYHQLVSTAARAEKVCSYDLDDVDAAWLSCANADRGMQVLPVISEFLMEQVIEELELQCWEQVQTILKSQEGLGIEYDENVICDVCRSPESEEGNEMVFCDSCNICVHQACYGITTIPSGSWLCRTCTLGIRPTCVLCPNVGGAMKATRSGQKWAHVACAIWIPEVSIGSVEKMEPITKISAIPQSRWSLICVLCKEKLGACIQCSVKTCKTAYHVTCAFKSGLEMKPIIVDENAEDGIKLRSYCQKHSVNTKKEKSANSGSEDDGEKKKARAMTAEERNAARAEKLQQIESEFYKYVRLKDVSQNLAVDMDIVLLIFNYWKLKRKSLNNRPLVPPRPETTQLLTQQQEQDLEQMKMFVQLRQDLERVRNLCYMVSRREKLSRTYFRLREQTFQKQVAILADKSTDVSIIAPNERCAIVDANHGPSIYDQIYSQNGADCSLKDYDTLVSLIAGEEKKDRVINGVIKPKKSSAASGPGTYVNSGSNSYKRQFVNGARRKNLIGESCSSLSESEASVSDSVVASTRKLKLSPSNSGRKPLSYLFDTDSSVDGITSSTRLVTAKGLADKGGKLLKGRSRGIQRTLKSTKKSSTSDSDELELPLPKATGGNLGKTEAPIYSDSDSEESSRKQNDSPVATKAAVKEFTRKSNKKEAPIGALTNKTISGPTKGRPKGPGRKKKGFEPTELIVPQREAAKKASESIRTVKQRKDLTGSVAEASPSYDLVNNTSSPLSPSRSKERESDSKERILEEKSKDNLPIPVTGKTRPKANRGNKNRSPDKKGVTGKPSKRGSNDGSSKNVSYVPQRQAAKKAAEHIRSGLSNIVAARLIIEDEMEAARKKPKDDKTTILKKPTEILQVSGAVKKSGKPRAKASPAPEEQPDETLALKIVEHNAVSAKSRANKRAVCKGGEEGRPIVKGGRKDLMSNNTSVEDITKDRDTDWPFLDQGSQSECRRSRERSSSSSSSSSSGSSSSNTSSSSRSSASSRSSSPASASPESNAHLRKTSSNIQSNQASSPPASLSVTPRGPGPSRKLKTSDRSPDSGPQHETITGKKPTPKGRGSAKLRPGRSSTGDKLTISPGPRAQQQLTSLGDEGRRSRQHKTSKSSSSSSSSECSPSPSSSRRKSEKNNKSPQEEGKRRTGEPSAFTEAEQNLVSAAELEVPASSKSSPKSQTRAKAKALISSTRGVSGVLDLSSDSENDSRVPSGASQQGIPKGSGSNLPTSSLSPAATPNDFKPVKPGTRSKNKDISNLSDSENEGANEKENSCRTPEVSISEATSSNSKNNKAQKSCVSSSALSILSPLTPSSENKEKDQCGFSRSSDTEPELKRARMDSGANNSQMSHLTGPQTTSTNAEAPLHTTSGGNFSAAVSLHAKSLFSPSRGGHDNELLDFDSELYDLARSVSADYSQCDEDGGMGGASGSLPFSFSQSLLCREDNGEDSAQATLNLVEKLRLQHARKSGCPRSSMDGSDLSMIEDGSKSPTSSVRLSCEKKIESSQLTGLIIDTPTIGRDESIFDESSKSVGIIPTISPGRDKCTQGDERWVPPSTGDALAIPSAVSPPLENELERNQKINKNHKKVSVLPTSTGSANIHVTQHQRSTPENRKEKMIPQVDSNIVAGKQHSTGIKNQFHQAEEDARRHECERNLYSDISDRMNKKEMQVEDQIPSKESPHVPVGSTASSLSTSASLTTSPIISPGIKLPRGTQSMHFNHPGQNMPPGHVGFPVGSPHSTFLYPLAGTPSVANVVNALAASIGSNSPHSSFFRPHAQHPGMSQQPATSSLSPGYPRQGFPSASNFLQTQQSDSRGQQQKSKTDNIVSPPTVSPSILSQRRSSNFMEEKSISDSLVSGVTSGMPPLAKPSIASPSMILAANNVKNIIPPPPPQSTVAQIIENVVNNHTNNSGLAVGAQDILSAILNITQQSSNAVSTSGLAPSATSKHKVSMASLTKTSALSTVSSLTEAEIRDNILNGGLIGSSKALEAGKPFSSRDRDYDQSNKDPMDGSRGNSSTAVSPRGRGRRATTPRAAAKTDKVLTTCETNGIKGKGRGERKSSTGTSPARAAKQPASRRGGGRGRGRGKGLAVTRKDLAGTVYDIDFDEFEENHDEKLDLRMLRERRKSSDIHVEGKATKSEVLNSPSDHRLISMEVLSPRHRELDVSRTVGDHQKIHNQSYSCSIPSNENIVPIPQPPLPGPVDMRTYNLGSLVSLENLSGGTPSNKGGFIPQKDTRIGDITSIFSSNSEKASIKNEYEDLDEVLDALTEAPKASAFSTFSRSSNPQSCVQQYNNLSSNQLVPTNSQSLQISREPLIETLAEPDIKNSMGDFSRNQLKVKIKGPFLDANYGSHSIPGDVSGSSQHYQSTFHHSASQAQAISAPTNNLRRMRKKELLRQYWTQDMNMDGSSCAPGYEAEISGISTNSMAHPINRSIITIPKAVASMAIIPTKDDYRLESMSNISDSPYGFGGMSTGVTKESAGGGGSVTEKRKRNRGMREMAALGIISCDTPRERRRDRMDTNLSTGSYSSEMMGKKRGKANKRPVRSTFIPPTLVDPEASNNEKKCSIKNLSVPSLVGSNAISTVVQTLNHPTPKLKIKFGDLSKNASGGLLANAAGHNNVMSDSSDKEAPNKKAKGRPPKKRGISEIVSAAPPSMEELKRQNMKFREMVMQDFAVEERKEILQLKGTRKHKKHKRKAGLLGRETDEAGIPTSQEVKVIAEGSKLILRFGKGRSSGVGTGAGGNEIGGSSSIDAKLKLAPVEGGTSSDVVEDLIIGENDSGFTGSSEGSSGSVSELTGASKERLPSSNIAANCSAGQIKTEPSPISMGSDGSYPISASIPSVTTGASSAVVSNHSGDLASQVCDVKPCSSLSEQANCSTGDKIMPIRLKLSRCGYALQQKPESCAQEGVPPTPTPTKQSDSCEVR